MNTKSFVETLININYACDVFARLTGTRIERLPKHKLTASWITSDLLTAIGTGISIEIKTENTVKWPSDEPSAPQKSDLLNVHSVVRLF